MRNERASEILNGAQPKPRSELRVGAVLLAAGASSRMGRPKLLLAWGGTSVIGHLLQQWRAVDPAQIAVVCTETNRLLHDELDRLQFPATQRLFNPEPERGMFSSIRCAAHWRGWQPGVTHWAIALGDQPLVRQETLRALIDFAQAHPHAICQPSRHGRGRHPVLLPASAFAQLKDSPVEHLKEFLATSGLTVARYESDDAGLDLDLDEPADYARALALAASP
jgi:molybdenum cofactor cytidylyltransferase